MFYFSKSKYTSLVQCPKMLWLKTYHPELAEEDPSAQERMSKGNVVGDLAMGLFGTYEEVTAVDENGKLDIGKMIANTNDAIQRGVENICEASFSYNGLYCAVDILRKENGGYAIYEVKSSTAPKAIYIVDISYQKYVLEKCGISVTGTYVVNVDSSYVFDGYLDIKQLFKITDVSDLVAQEYDISAIEARLQNAERMLACKDEPNIDLSIGCNDPYPCAFWKYCTRHVPAPSVFDIYKMPFKKALDLYARGFSDLEDALAYTKLNDLQKQYIDYALHDKPEHVDKDGIKSFLDGLTYPLYFLDFETMQLVIPEYPNSKPYQQIPFQYSLHYIENENGTVMHKEFLGVSGEDPRRALAEQLVADIPENACVLAFNRGFERGRIKELALLFPDLADKLMGIHANIYDLIDPFHHGHYYNKAISNSFSIKSVLPAMFPNDAELDYHNLDGVHNGSEAMTLFPLIKDMPPAEQEIARRNLLKYCELDTYAMVKIWQKLKALSE